MSTKEKVNMDYLKCCVADRYFLFSDLTKEKKTLIMKSILIDKIIKYIYFIADNNPRATEKITVTAIGINEIKAQFFETSIEIENLPCNWEYWQKLSEDAAIEINQWHQQEKEQQEQLELKNNQTTMDVSDYLSEYMNQKGIKAFPPFYLIQRQGTIPRLAIHIEDWCKILESTGGDELEIKKLHELIDSNNSDTKKRAILQNNKKYSEAAKHRRNRFPEYHEHCMEVYKDSYEYEIEEIYQKLKNTALSYEQSRAELNSSIINISRSIRTSIEKSITDDIKSKLKHKVDLDMSIAKFIRLYEAEKLFKRNFEEKKYLMCSLPQHQLINEISKSIEKLGLLNKVEKKDRPKKYQFFYNSCVDNKV